MADDIVDLQAIRNAREQPDPKFIVKDEFGRPWYTFIVSYDDGTSEFSFHILALDGEDAQRRVDLIRTTARVDGKLFNEIPA